MFQVLPFISVTFPPDSFTSNTPDDTSHRFKFLSQKERILFQGPDTRKFYLDSENRNRSMAEKYHKLGLTEYEAMEVFKKL